jgi:hypothetical protein
MKRLFGALLAGGLLFGMIANAGAKPTTVFEDPSGDAGNSQAGAIPGAEQGGFDLVGGRIERKGNNLEFTVEHSAMPATGTLPEGFRFLWHFIVGKNEYRFTIKSADIGKPDAAAQSGTERVGQVDLDGHFRLETCFIEATPAIQLSQCTPVAYLDGSFDPAAKTFTAIVPLKTVKAKPGDMITGGTGGAAGTGCVICWVPHYAERSLTPYTLIDSAVQTVAYKIPR